MDFVLDMYVCMYVHTSVEYISKRHSTSKPNVHIQNELLLPRCFVKPTLGLKINMLISPM